MKKNLKDKKSLNIAMLGHVVKSFARLIEDGVYQKNLFEDLK